MAAETCSKSCVEALWKAAICLASLALSNPALAVVGPSAEAPGLAPFTVMVLQRSGRVAGFCSGIVMAPRVVLTAAHCAPPGADLRVHFKEADGTPVLLPVETAARHPDYRADAIRTRRRSIDLALLRLPRDLPARFRPVTIGTSTSATVGQAFRLAGFGVTREDEGASSGTLRMADLAARAPLSSLLLWAEDPAHRGAGACTGDSGGPVFGSASDTVEAIALWSAGDGAKRCGTLTQALWLAPQRRWIDGIMAGWGAAP